MLSTLLLAWYDQHKRVLPFRGTKDPYRIWVSEIMLQQTRTETVGAYYQRFLQRFPDVFALAEAPEQDVLKCWEGLGYYSRARNLHKAAQVVAQQYKGQFPADIALLRGLPGVGDYTAAAVGSIAFDLPAPAMDGNLTRVLARYHGIRQDVGIPTVKRQLADLAREDMPSTRCGDFNQALMDLGATVCTPGTPDCERCPLRPLCDAYRAGDAEELPVKEAAKPPKDIQLAVVLVTCHGRVLMCQRKEALLNGLWVYPLIEDAAGDAAIAKGLKALGVRGAYRATLGPARHVFTHRVWHMTIYHYEAERPESREGRFVSLAEMNALPLPTAIRSAKEHAVRLLTPQFVPAGEALLPSVSAVYARSWRQAHAAHCSPDFLNQHTPPFMEMLLRGHIDAGKNVFAVQETGITEGVLVIDRQENELVSLYIRPEAQNVGLGQAAVRFAISQLDERRDMKVTCLCDNAVARHVYRQCGFCTVTVERTLNPAWNVREETRVRKGRHMLPLSALHPSQLYISEEKLRAVRQWFCPGDLINFEPLPVKRDGDLLYLTDGHTRAAAAWLAGLTDVPVCDETDELDWQAYRVCLRWCDEEGVDTIEKLARRVIGPADYAVLWNQRCDEMHKELGWQE
ncbi:MAG: A/G-specific adenine glycosylase [Clostridia bacterium]|nr:A/G-specific adenine glycosylase [Clostridia bacterium]